MQKNLLPNSTQMPNIFLDRLFPRIPEAEHRCLEYVCRRTFGFHKDEDRISLTQFIAGVRGKDYGTGLSRASVVEALKNLVGAEVLFKEESTRGNYFRVNLRVDVDKVVQKIDQFRKQTKSSIANRPKAVHLLNLQKKGNKGNKELLLISTLKRWNDAQSSPIPDFVPENIIRKHGLERVDKLVKDCGKLNGGFSLFLKALKRQ